MKRFLYLLSILGLLITGCSDDSNVTTEGQNGASKATVQGYVTINLSAPGVLLSPYTLSSRDSYQDGSPQENYVNLVRFYFFDNAGNAVLVNEDPYNEDEFCSFFDWMPSTDDNDNAPNNPDETVEKIMQTTLELTKPDNYSARPTMVIAVVNPPQSVLNLGSASKSLLTACITDFCTSLTNKNFVMSNSVYVDMDGTLMDYTPIASNNLATSALAARSNPVTVYVERVVARVDLSFTGDNVIPVENQENVYETNVTFEPLDDPSVSEPVNVKFLGWAVTSSPTESRLIKSIDSQWPNNMFTTGIPWNSDDFHRSFWAINPDEVGYIWYSYDEIAQTATGQPTGLPMSQNIAYIQENANPYGDAIGLSSNPTYPSQVIVAAQLVDSDGNPVTIAEYNRQQYTVAGLKNYIASNLNLYTKNLSGVYERITPDQLTFVSSTQWNGESGPEIGGAYFVYFVLTPEAEGLIWYTSASYGQAETDDFTVIQPSQINQYIYDSANRAMIWNNGMTYYFLNIRHLGPQGSTGYYGVVRNHIYNTVVTKINGLGTPVYIPSETIYPEEVDYTGSLLAAQVQILQWRLVNGGYEFSW